MPRKTSTAPLKAYRITFYGEAVPELFVGRTPGQARAHFARSGSPEGLPAAQVWPGIRSRRASGAAAGFAVEDFEDAGKYWRDTRRTQRLQETCDAFNAAHPVGTPCRLVGCCEAEEGAVTRIRTPAWVPCENNILVSIEGHSGGFYLKYIEVLASDVVGKEVPGG